MKSNILWRLALLITIAVNISMVHADNLSWQSDDELPLLSLTALPSYDPNTHLLTQVSTTLTDNTLASPYIYPPFIFLFSPPSPISPTQTVSTVKGKSTVSGELKFHDLKSSTTSTFLLINLTYGTEVVQTQNAQGSVVQISLTDPTWVPTSSSSGSSSSGGSSAGKSSSGGSSSGKKSSANASSAKSK